MDISMLPGNKVGFKKSMGKTIILNYPISVSFFRCTENPPLIVSINDKGDLTLGQDRLSGAQVFEQLQRLLRDAVVKNPDLKLAINADTNAPWGQIVKVMDAAKAAKIKSVSANTRAAAKP